MKTIKQEILNNTSYKKAIREYFEEELSVRDAYELIDDLLNSLDISADDIEESQQDGIAHSEMVEDEYTRAKGF